MKNQKGITLLSLVITIAILIIIAGISINTATDSLDATRLKGFYMQLEIVQKRVDDIASTNESYVDENGQINLLINEGKTLTDEQKINLNAIIQPLSVQYDSSDFRYFTSQEINDILGIRDIEYDLFINFNDRLIIAEDGIEIKGKRYYMLNSTMYFIKNNSEKSNSNINLKFNALKYGNNKYKLEITLENSQNNAGNIKYKEIRTNYWDTSNKMYIIIDDISKYYDIKYQDINGNVSEEKTVGIILNEEGNPVVADVIKIFNNDQLFEIQTSNEGTVTAMKEHIENNQIFSALGNFIQINERQIRPIKQEYATNPSIDSNKNSYKIYVLMNDLKIDLSEEKYWTPVGETQIKNGIFDGNNKKISITYTDQNNEKYTIVYDKTNNYCEKKHKIEILPILEDGTPAQNAYVVIKDMHGKILMEDKINSSNQLIEFSLKRKLEEIIIESYIEGEIYSTPINVKIDNPNKIVPITPILDNAIVTVIIQTEPNDATVTINGQNVKSIKVQVGTVVNWTVSDENYISKSGTYTATSDLTQNINVALEPKMVTFTINPTPSDATVTINGQKVKAITVQSGTTINWTVSKEHYNSRSGTYVATPENTQNMNVTLEPKMVTFAINPTPSDAIVTINGQVTKSLDVIENSTVTWSVSKTYYNNKSGNYTMKNTNYSTNVSLTEKPTNTLTVNASGATGSNITNVENAADGVNSSNRASAWLGADRTCTMTFSGLNNIDPNAKIVSMSAEFKLLATLSPYFNAKIIAGSRTCGTYREEFTSAKTKKFTVTANNLPKGSEVRSGTSLAVTFENTASSALGYWYGSTLTIKYIQP